VRSRTLAGGLLVAGCALGLAWGQSQGSGMKPAKSFSGKVGNQATAKLESKSGSKVGGEALFQEGKESVTLHLLVTGAEPGVHAVHIHETGDCSAPDASSAGGHWNPSSENHGKWGAAPFHHGDIGNVEVGADGRAQLTLSSKLWTIGGPPETNVLGHAIIVHAKADDFTTQPSGNAGGRVACGVIEKQQ
jgi:Cu-Zn family superoxide dismutase